MEAETRQQLEMVLSDRLKDRTHSQEAEWWKNRILLEILDTLTAINSTLQRSSEASGTLHQGVRIKT